MKRLYVNSFITSNTFTKIRYNVCINYQHVIQHVRRIDKPVNFFNSISNLFDITKTLYPNSLHKFHETQNDRWIKLDYRRVLFPRYDTNQPHFSQHRTMQIQTYCYEITIDWYCNEALNEYDFAWKRHYSVHERVQLEFPRKNQKYEVSMVVDERGSGRRGGSTHYIIALK